MIVSLVKNMVCSMEGISALTNLSETGDVAPLHDQDTNQL